MWYRCECGAALKAQDKGTFICETCKKRYRLKQQILPLVIVWALVIGFDRAHYHYINPGVDLQWSIKIGLILFALAFGNILGRRTVRIPANETTKSS